VGSIPRWREIFFFSGDHSKYIKTKNKTNKQKPFRHWAPYVPLEIESIRKIKQIKKNKKTKTL